MTDICGLLTDEDAVSPVIGVILMVAVTVVLSAAVGAFVLDIGNAVTETSPQAKIGFNGSFPSGSNDTVTLSHGGGDTLQADRLSVTIDGTVAWRAGSSAHSNYSVGRSNWTGEVDSGDELVVVEVGDGSVDPGMRVQVVWTRGQQSSILATQSI